MTFANLHVGEKITMPNQLIDLLRDLNSKERFFLVGYALGNPTFKPGHEFRNALGTKLGLPIPEDAFCAMDYHIDWIHAALVASRHGVDAHYRNDGLIMAQQEDVDLLVAFERNGIVHLILIEAKAATAWTNGQAESKIERLKKIFGNDADRWSGVRPHFVLMSPTRPARLHTNWPYWAVDGNLQPLWIPLPIPDSLLKVSRWDDQTSKPRKEGEFWKILSRKRSGTIDDPGAA